MHFLSPPKMHFFYQRNKWGKKEKYMNCVLGWGGYIDLSGSSTKKSLNFVCALPNIFVIYHFNTYTVSYEEEKANREDRNLF